MELLHHKMIIEYHVAENGSYSVCQITPKTRKLYATLPYTFSGYTGLLSVRTNTVMEWVVIIVITTIFVNGQSGTYKSLISQEANDGKISYHLLPVLGNLVLIPDVNSPQLCMAPPYPQNQILSLQCWVFSSWFLNNKCNKCKFIKFLLTFYQLLSWCTGVMAKDCCLRGD